MSIEKMPIDYTLYLVTDRAILKGRDMFEAVERAIKSGVTILQLREKDVSSLEFYNIAKRMIEITRHHNVPLIINDRLDIALAVDADGLHIGQEDLPIKEARELLGKGKILGYSATTVHQAVFGENNGADYIGAGPIYPTGSKLDAAPPMGLENLREIKKLVTVPVVGIGGIGLSNIAEVKSTGIDGVSLISAILGNNDIEGATNGLLELWR